MKITDETSTSSTFTFDVKFSLLNMLLTTFKNVQFILKNALKHLTRNKLSAPLKHLTRNKLSAPLKGNKILKIFGFQKKTITAIKLFIEIEGKKANLIIIWCFSLIFTLTVLWYSSLSLSSILCLFALALSFFLFLISFSCILCV